MVRALGAPGPPVERFVGRRCRTSELLLVPPRTFGRKAILVPGPVAADCDLVGNVFRATDSKGAAGEILVTRDPGGEYVWVENVEPPHTQRRILRARLLTYRYEHRGRADAPMIDGRRWSAPPAFDGPGFAKWLRRYMESEGLGVAEVARRAGLHPGMLHLLRRGTPSSTAAAKGQKALHPAIETIAAVAHALELQFSYVASKAGFDSEGDRMANFSFGELSALAELLDCEVSEIDELITELAIPRRKESV